MSEMRGYYDQSYPPDIYAPPVPPPVPATGATAGIPGTWTPNGSVPPANAAGATSTGVVASPATAWTVGQYVQGSTAGIPGEMNWSGTAWVAGRHALSGEEVAGMTIDDVKDFIRANPTLLSEVTAFERNGKKRQGLLTWLDELLAEEQAP